MNTKIFFCLLYIILLLPFPLHAEEKINEEDLFSDPSLVIEAKKVEGEIPPAEEKNIIGYSAEITGVGEVTHTKDKSVGGNILSSYILGNFFLDARLKKGTKYFANLEVLNRSRSTSGQAQSTETDFTLRESFIDINIKNKIYFRGGKQVLQWGRAYLWNPSDLVNVEKKPFIKKIGSREGTFGLKAHAPFGTKYNIYGFLDVNEINSPNEVGSALKYEFVLDKTEMSISAWHKKGFRPVYAFDASTRVFGIDTVLESALSHGDNFERVREENGVLVKYKNDSRWIPRASIDFGRQFDFMEINDRISINLEFYYNDTGYTENVLSDPLKKVFILANNLYDPNNFSKYYAAFFSTFNKFILSDMSLTLNLIRNLNDQSNIVSLGINYKDTINDFNIGVNFYSYIGKKDSEYTFSNNSLTTQLILGVVF